VLAVAEAAGIKEPVVVGHSLGASDVARRAVIIQQMPAVSPKIAAAVMRTMAINHR
jgi:pimeloyl-ACP methyl ester carboxylesterase